MNTISKIIVLLIFIFIGTAGVVYAGGPECGDGIVQEPEQCDDGNIISGDGCNALCQEEFCGDGIVQEPELCDDGNLLSGDGCNALCQEEFCGDGIVQEPELCDDGNLLSGDGCNALCQIEFCGDGIVQEPELCDDGNLLNGDGCTTLCLIEFCGDGTVQVPEQCDDGNIISGDGCSAACTFDFGDQGCRPRYWKKSKHFGSWTAPFAPDTPFSSIFEDAFPGKSLRQVLKKDGEGLEGLGRQAVAALLNAASADVAYDRTVQQVIVMFNNVYPGTKHDYKALKNVFKALNELGCPLRTAENED